MTSSDLHSSRHMNAFDTARVVTVVAAFSIATGVIVNASISGTYGLPVAADATLQLEAALQICPALAGFCSMFLVGIADRRINARHSMATGTLRLLWHILAAAATLALIFAAATYAVTTIYILAGGGHAYQAGSGWLWLGYTVDLLMLMIFAQFVHALTRRWYLSVLIFVGYFASIVVLGANLSDVDLIGFGTTPRVTVTAHDTRPIGIEAAWVWRIHWVLVSATLAIVLSCFDRRPRPLLAFSSPLALPQKTRLRGAIALAATLGMTAFVASTLTDRKQAVALRYPAGADMLPASFPALSDRVTLTGFDIDIVANSSQRLVAIEGKLTIANRTGRALQYLAFEKSQLLRLSTFSPEREHRLWRGAAGRMLLVRLARPLGPGEDMRIAYTGGVDATDIFDNAARATVLSNAFFLGTASMLPLPRRPICFAEKTQPMACNLQENYQLSDPSAGRITVAVPRDIIVAGARHMPSSSANAEFVLDIAPRSIGNILVADGPVLRRFPGVARLCIRR